MGEGPGKGWKSLEEAGKGLWTVDRGPWTCRARYTGHLPTGSRRYSKLAVCATGAVYSHLKRERAWTAPVAGVRGEGGSSKSEVRWSEGLKSTVRANPFFGAVGKAFRNGYRGGFGFSWRRLRF